MAQMLASDLNNPEFAGAINPDSRLAVRFYKHAVKNEFESNKQNRPIYFDVDYVEIYVPGDPTTVIVQPVRDDHKQRFPLHWARYQNIHGGEAKEVGTPLEQWPLISKSQVEELKALKFYTVESVAGASDQQLQRIGMIAGMSPFAFRDRASRFLKVAMDESVANEAEDRAKALQEQNDKLAKQMEELQARVAELSQPKKRGRKPKVAAE